MRRRSPLVLLLTLAIAVMTAAACSGGGGSGDDDDDDDIATTQTPLPPSAAFCYVIWGSTGAGGVVTEYYVDFPAAAWTTAGGVVTIDDVDNWAELAQYDSGGAVIFSMVATAGTIAVVSAPEGLEAGDAVGFDDDDAQLFTDYARGLTGTAGAGTFTGVWSDSASPLFTPEGKTLGSGTISLPAVSGTASVPAILGAAYSYAQCYELGAGAVTRADRTTIREPR